MKPILMETDFTISANGGLGEVELKSNLLYTILIAYQWAGLSGFSRLFKNNFNPTRLSKLSDFHEVTTGDWSGYAAKSSPFIGVTTARDDDGNWMVTTNVLDWLLAVPATKPVVVYGVFNDDGAGHVASWFKFPQGVTLAKVGDQVPVQWRTKIFSAG